MVYNLSRTLQEERHGEENPHMVSVHMRCPIPMSWALLHRRTDSHDGVPMDTLFVVGLSSILRLYM